MIARTFFFCIVFAAAITCSGQDNTSSAMSDRVDTQAQDEFVKSLLPKDVLTSVGAYSSLISSLINSRALFWNALIEYYLMVMYTVDQINGNNDVVKNEILSDWYKEIFILTENCLGNYLPCYRQPGVEYKWNGIARVLITFSNTRSGTSSESRIKTGSLRLSKPFSNLLKHAGEVFDELNGTSESGQSNKSGASAKNKTELTAGQKSQKMMTQLSLLMNSMRLIAKMELVDYEALGANQKELFKRLVVFAYLVYGDNHVKSLDCNDLVFEPKKAFAGISNTKLEKMFMYLRGYQVDELFDGISEYNVKDALVKLNTTLHKSASSGSESKNKNVSDGKAKNCKADIGKAKKSDEGKFGSMWKWGLIIAAALLILAAAGYLIYYLVKSKE